MSTFRTRHTAADDTLADQTVILIPDPAAETVILRYPVRPRSEQKPLLPTWVGTAVFYLIYGVLLGASAACARVLLGILLAGG